MTWIHLALLLIPSAILSVQGTSCLWRRDGASHVRQFGWLSIGVSGLYLLVSLLLSSDTLVLSPELYLGMGQGNLAWYGMALLLVGLAISSGAALQVSRLEADRGNLAHWLLGIGAIIGCLAAYRLQPLNPTDFAHFHVYAYDLWWPILLVWLTLCFVETILTILHFENLPARLWLSALAITGVAALALTQPRLGDPSSKDLWQVYWRFLLPCTMTLITYLLLHCNGQTWLQAFRRGALAAPPAAVGLLNALYWHGDPLPEIAIGLWRSIVRWSGETPHGMLQDLALLSLGWPLFVSLFQWARQHVSTDQPWAQPTSFHIRCHPTYRQGILLIIALSLIATEIIHLQDIDRSIGVAIFVVACILLAEALMSGPLADMVRQSGSRIPSPKQPTTAEGGLYRRLVEVMSVSSMPAALVKTLVALVLLIAVNEIPNAGKTLIQPFKVSETVGSSDLGRSVTEHMVSALGSLRQDLRKKAILSLRASDDDPSTPDGESDQDDSPHTKDTEGRGGFTLVTASESVGNVDAIIDKSMALEISGAKIPLGVLFAPIQAPMRVLMGVRVISGSLQVEEDGYSLLANSTAGETWKATWKWQNAADRKTSGQAQAIASMTEELAFKIIGSEPRMAPAMTTSPKAFRAFKNGLQHWEDFDNTKDLHALNRAIEEFRRAVQEDTGFGLAYYRLGLAQQKDGQPGLAAKTFRESLKAAPNFSPAYVALASVLYDFESSVASLGLMALGGMGFPEARETRLREAHNLWLQITQFPAEAVSVPNQAIAYYGLCRQAIRQSRRPMGDRANIFEGEKLSYLAHFYCRQAEARYAGLPRDRRAKPGIKMAEARVLHALGSGLERIQRKQFEEEAPKWDCWAGEPTQRPNASDSFRYYESPYAPTSLRYYVRALTLVPDDRRIQCYAARTAYVLGKSELLERLNLDPAAHVNVAIRQRRWANTCSLIERRNAKIDTYLREIQVHDRLVKRCQSSNGMPKSVDYFRRAFEEFHKAIVRDELSFEALTGYADTYWEWWVNWQSSMVRDEMTAVAEKRAERYAHRAMALAADRPDPTALPLAQFTLGKVLLARGQPREAITRISSALEDFKAAVDNVAHRPSFDDMRLSLLQVYRCASDTYVRAGLQGSLQSLNGKISDLVNEIQKDDRMRAFQAVGSRLGALDAIGKRPICSRESIIESF